MFLRYLICCCFVAAAVAVVAEALPTLTTDVDDDHDANNNRGGGVIPMNRNLLSMDFSISDAVSMTVDSTTDPNSWSIQMDYGYGGPGVDFVVAFLDYASCASNLADNPMPLQVSAISSGGSGFILNIQLDVAAAETSSIWTFADDTQNSATVAFCARVDLYYQSVFVNFVKTMTSISVHTANGGFEAFNAQQNVATRAATTAQGDVELSYPVNIYPCDHSATMLAESPTVFPGTAVRFCVTLASQAGGDNTAAAVTLSGINTVRYHGSNDPGATPIMAIQNGAPYNNLASLDCSYGVCLVEFIPMGSFFYDNAPPLVVDGDAIISFSNGGGRRERQLGPLVGSGTTSQSAFSFQVKLGSTREQHKQGSDSTTTQMIEEGALFTRSYTSGVHRYHPKILSSWCLAASLLLSSTFLLV